MQEHIGKVGGDERHFPLGEIRDLRGLVDDYHGHAQQGVGTAHGDPVDQHLEKVDH